MTNETTPYISRNPGDLITSENWNDVQVKVKEDIAGQVGQVETALNEFKEAPVDADTFDAKTPEEWKEDLDTRYAPLEHTHDGVRRYHRYFLELETVVAGPPPRLQPAVIIHDMGRHPVVQVYELLELPIASNENLPRPYKFCFCGPAHAPDPEAIDFKTKSWDERHWGNSIDDVIQELVSNLEPEQQKKFMEQFQSDFTLSVWLTNLEKALFEPGPAQFHFDMGDVYRTPWINHRADRPVDDLKKAGEWPPRFVYRPILVNFVLLRPDKENMDEIRPVPINIFHLNLKEVEIAPQIGEELHLMVLLRA